MGERHKSVMGWHPLTKLLVGLGVVAVPYLVLTQEESAPAAATAPAAPILETQAQADPNLGPFSIPELATFSSTVERPLFAPDRRPTQPPAEPVVEEATVEDVPDEVPPPDLKFFGTLTQDGRTLALVTPADGSGAQKLGEGDTFADWQVTEVSPDRLTLGQGDREAVFTIFDEKSHSADSAAPGLSEPAPQAALEPPPGPGGAGPNTSDTGEGDGGGEGADMPPDVSGN
ncbi:MAG: hypothetical protein U1E45_03805 [Geminicoccaceae bacterium]